MRADLEAELRRIAPYQAIHAVGGDRSVKPSSAFVTERSKQRAGLVEAMPAGVEVVIDQSVRAGMQRQIARLLALVGNFQMRNAYSRLLTMATVPRPFRTIIPSNRSGKKSFRVISNWLTSGMGPPPLTWGLFLKKSAFENNN